MNSLERLDPSKATVFDPTPVRVLKMCANELAYLLTMLFSCCFEMRADRIIEICQRYAGL